MSAVACACCGMDISGVPGDKCHWCRNGDGDGAGEGCDMTRAWHCFTASCDGTGCTYPGECQEKDDTFRDYHVGDRVRISEDWGGSSPDSGTVEGVLESGEIAVRLDGLPVVWNISPIFLTPVNS